MLQLQADFRDPDCAQPIDFGRTDAPEQICRNLEQYGFAVATMPRPGPPDGKLTALATALGLGHPYVPALYRYAETKEYSASYSDIRSNPDEHHPGFSTTDGQGWHVDGLLDQIGQIKTTILYCVQGAQAGGETLVYNSTAAFAALQKNDPGAAAALLSTGALTRRSTIPAVDRSSTGPAFALDSDGNYITRYTDNETCVWRYSGGSGDRLNTALDFMRVASEDPQYRRAILLGSGQALVFRNDRLSHGRRPYTETTHARRHLVRGLYADAPSADV